MGELYETMRDVTVTLNDIEVLNGDFDDFYGIVDNIKEVSYSFADLEAKMEEIFDSTDPLSGAAGDGQSLVRELYDKLNEEHKMNVEGQLPFSPSTSTHGSDNELMKGCFHNSTQRIKIESPDDFEIKT